MANPNHPNARARAVDPVEAAKSQSSDAGYRSVASVLGAPTPPPAPPPLPAVEPAPVVDETPGVLPVELPPSKKYKVVGAASVRLNGIKINLSAGKIIDTAAYGHDIAQVLSEQGVALKDYVA